MDAANIPAVPAALSQLPETADAGRLRPRVFWPAVDAVCLLALLLRLPTLASRSLWLDETYSAWFSALTLHQLWTDVPRYETHPPMYYSMLVGWRALFGASEAALRSLSVLAGVLAILAVACAGRVLRTLPGRDATALVAALFLAVNTGSIAYAQQARPYALETLAATLAILAAWSLLERLLAGRTGLRDVRRPAAALALATGATLWMHDTGAVVALGIWAGLALTLLGTPAARAAGRRWCWAGRDWAPSPCSRPSCPCWRCRPRMWRRRRSGCRPNPRTWWPRGIW